MVVLGEDTRKEVLIVSPRTFSTLLNETYLAVHHKPHDMDFLDKDVELHAWQLPNIFVSDWTVE